MKILLVAPYFKDSFVGNISMGSAVKTAEQLSRNHDVLVVTTGRDQVDERMNPSLRVLSASGWLVPDPVNYVFSPQALYRVYRSIRSFEPDLVIVNKFMFFTSFAAPLARLMGKRTIVVTDTYPGLNWFPRNRLVAKVMWLYARLVGVPILRSAHRVVLLHEGLIPIAERYGLNYVVIHNGCDVEAADASVPASDLVKPEGEVWVCYVGRLESVKGYDFLLEAMDSIHSDSPHIRTFFVGAIPADAERVLGTLRVPESVRFLGFRDDVFAVLKRMDVFCLPSLNEGLPNALMEAMVVGCAPVASAVGGVRILIEHEQQGLLVPAGDTEALGSAIRQLVDDAGLRKRLATAARERIEKEFSWKLIREEYETLFQTLFEASGARSEAVR